MTSFTTIYRTVVMIAVGAIGVKGWQLYGPSNEQVKSTVMKVVDMAQAAWNKQRSSTMGSRLDANPPGSAPLVTSMPPASAPSNLVLPPVLTPAQPAAAGAALNAAPTSSMPPPPLIAAPATATVAPAQASPEDRVTSLMSKLEKLGASETKLSPWGSSGNLYRFSCRATPADSPALAEHFESVAAEPAAAVEQVLAKIEAWRTVRQSDAMLR